jgi:hypothetical protein
MSRESTQMSRFSGTRDGTKVAGTRRDPLKGVPLSGVPIVPIECPDGLSRSPNAAAVHATSRQAPILALDPGPEQTGWVLYDGERVHSSAVEPNAAMLERVEHWQSGATLAIEMIASYGMPVGREVFETCVWIGRFMQAWRDPADVRLVYRQDVKLHLCGSPRAKDSNVRQALLDLFPRTGGGATPQIGTKKQPGPLYGVSSHAWPALGVAVTVCAQGAS